MATLMPRLRFRGFDDLWEQNKFDKIFDCTLASNTLSRSDLNYENGSVRNIHYGDILTKYGSIIDVKNDELPFATGKSCDDFKGALLQDGDIIIADTAEDETAGKACEIGNSQGLNVVSGLHTMVCRPRNKMASGYLGYYINSDAYHYQLLPLMQGIKVLSLSRTNVQKTLVCYPKSTDEQHLIADCFRSLDNLIILYQHKHDKLIQTKKAMLVKMFPKAGETVPEVRIKGFASPWELRKFNSIATLSRGLTYSPSCVVDANQGVRVLRSSNINEDGFELHDDDVFVREDAVSIEECSEGNILITASNGSSRLVGKHAIISGLKGRTVHGGFMLRAKTDEPDFLNALMNSTWYQRFLGIGVSGGNGALGNLDKKALEESALFIPERDERDAIGIFFHNLDDLITLQQRKLRSLKSLKRALLEKMFV